MNILVTGHSGWIGKVISDYLSESFNIYGISRRAGHHRQLSGLIMGDLTDPYTKIKIASVTPVCDVIVHCAGVIEDTSEASLVNCYGAHQIMDLANIWGSQVIYISSIGVIGHSYSTITESTPPRPETAYHHSKLYGEHLVEIVGKDLTTAILRIAPPIGPGMDEGKILSTFISRALQGQDLEIYGHGTRKQTYVDIFDIAQAVKGCIDYHASGIFNIAGNECISNLDLARRVKHIIGSESNISLVGSSRPDWQDNFVFDISNQRAKDVIKFMPTDLDTSIKEIGSS